MSDKLIYKAPGFDYWTAEKLDLIEAQMSGGSGGTANGTMSFPFVIELDTEYSKTGNEFWFECTSVGAADFRIFVEDRASILIYKHVRLSSDLTILFEGEIEGNGSRTVQLWKKSDIYDGWNTYLISVATISTPYISSMTIKANEHVDEDFVWTTKKWIPHPNSAASWRDGNYRYNYCYFANANMTDGIYRLIQNDKFLYWSEKFVNGIIDITGFAGFVKNVLREEWSEILKGVVTDKIVNLVPSIADLTKFQSKLLDELDDITSHGRGVRLIERQNDPLYRYQVEEWNSPDAYGLTGWMGEWTDV